LTELSFEKRSSKSSIVFCLARGYKNRYFYKYFKLCIRNLAIRIVFGAKYYEFQHVIFHEGNIKRFQQFFIRFFSISPLLQFVSLIDEWPYPLQKKKLELEPNTVWDRGYIGMCRFHYAFAWDYLNGFETAIRIDDDVILLKLNLDVDVTLFDFAFLSGETHEATNLSLGNYCNEILNQKEIYDQEFPYTNFYITKTKFWVMEKTQSFLKQIANRPEGVSDRWGDATVLGLAMKHFKVWNDARIRDDIAYFHLSHRTIVRGGENLSILQAVSRFSPHFGKFLGSVKNKLG
jgi:hypothetical protein